MQSKLKQILLCCALLLCCAMPRASAQLVDSSAYSLDTTAGPDAVAEDSETDESYESDDEEPARVVIYNKQRPSETRWLQMSSDDAYNYRTKREYVERPVEPVRETPGWIRAIEVFFLFFRSAFGQVLLWTLLVVIVGYIAYRIIAGDGGLFGKRDIKAEPETSGDDVSEDGLMEISWDARMREAMQAGEQRQAIRFGYLYVLQQLQTRELIQFRQDKTNIAYYRELSDTLRPEFRKLTRVYEFAWYGNFLPDASGLKDYLATIEQFLQRIPRS